MPPTIHKETENGVQEETKLAEPLHIQRLEAALDMRTFMAYARNILAQPLTSEEDDFDCKNSDNGNDDSDGSGEIKKKHTRLLGTKEERQSVKAQIYNFNDLTNDREWLYDVLLSDTETETEISDEDEYIKEMLKEYTNEQKHRENFYKKATNTQYAYYGTGLLSNHDMYPEHQQSIVGVRKRKRRTKKEKQQKLPKRPKLPKFPKQNKLSKLRRPRKQRFEKPEPGEVDPADLKNYAFGDTTADNDDDDIDLSEGLESGTDNGITPSNSSGLMPVHHSRGRRRRGLVKRTPEMMAAHRRRVWQLMAKKEIGRCQRAKVNNHKEVVQNCKKISAMCMKVVRQRAMHSQKVMKETVWRAKRLTREMLGYWKRYERIERDTRRRMEREAEEQRKMDVELIEAKRQQRKLNFLITQTELYAHFMSKKLGQGTEEEQLRILNQLDEEINPRLAAYDDYNAEHMKLIAQKNAENAYDADRAKTEQFDVAARRLKEEEIENEKQKSANIGKKADVDLPQPKLFKGTLKAYQIKGMTWLANLYDQGISGILADEMGLGKTVQSIAFLCHIAERYGVWGPFLIISPASTLHNWQQEIQRFAPDFNVVPYWGSPNERKILRQFWEQKDLHTREASFHVVITSYQLIVSDYKYFNRIKWQYMILDEAQAIKSSSSMRWKLLLGFNCRNRLLLSGTPIQNSMAELWALLHFIMPTLFDSHDEFNEWFSKDIESHAENKTGIDEKQISRLHMILKPFMLRRIKKDVENELSDKIEIMVYCPLTTRQKLLYMALKKKIRIEDLLHLTRSGAGNTSESQNVDRNFTTNLMNLVMQFRKVCNHPELFERRDAKSPFAIRCQEYTIPRLVYNECLLSIALPSKKHLLYNKFSIFKAAYIQETLFSEPKRKAAESKKKCQQNVAADYASYVDLNVDKRCCFSFSRFSDLSIKDLEDLTINGLIALLSHYRRNLEFYKLLAYRYYWWRSTYKPTRFLFLEPMLEKSLHLISALDPTSILNNLLFTTMTSTIYAFGNYKTVNIQETIEHRVIRSKYLKSQKNSFDESKNLIEELTPEYVLDDDDSQTSSIAVATKYSSRRKTAVASTSLTNQASSLLLPEFTHVERPPKYYQTEPLELPRFLYGWNQRVQAYKRRWYCDSRAAEWAYVRHTLCDTPEGLDLVNHGLSLCRPNSGWSSIVIPDKQTLVSDAGKLFVLDSLLTRLKAQGHRVLIYSQMTKMIDLLEEYMWHRKHRYMRLDGSSKISARRDMVADFQSRADIFVFLLSTRAGGLGINLTAADTVIFYDSDWNPTVDQQAMDRAHRLGQTKQVTVYRLICKGTIEERILQRAREKSEIQRMVISGGNFKPDSLKAKEVVSLLLDDEEIELKYRQKAESSTNISQVKETIPNENKRRRNQNKANQATTGGITTVGSATKNKDTDNIPVATTSKCVKRLKADEEDSIDVTSEHSSSFGLLNVSTPVALNEPFVPGATTVMPNDESDNEALVVDDDIPLHGTESPIFGEFGSIGRFRRRHHPRGTRRGRPRGSTSTRRGTGTTVLQRSISSPVTGGGQQQKQQQKNSSATGEDLEIGGSPTAPITNIGENVFTATIPPTPMKRGPGRPRLKTAGGPPNQGTRGTPRTRKPIGPLVVPLGQSPAATPLNRSPAMSPARSPAHSDRSSQSGSIINMSNIGLTSGSKDGHFSSVNSGVTETTTMEHK